MARLEDLTPGAAVRGILPDGPVTVVAAQWYGRDALELTFKDAAGRPGTHLLYRDDEPALAIAETGRPWSFDGDGRLFRLVAEAHRIRLAHLFDPLLAVHTSIVEPLPHQITAVYETMLPRQPLRFLLADDPGAGKTIMAGLLIKELIARGDLQRCLIVCPGSLAEQWQDELYQRFHLPFELLDFRLRIFDFNHQSQIQNPKTFAIARQWRALVTGVEGFNRDHQHRHIPVQSNDETGFLTRMDCSRRLTTPCTGPNGRAAIAGCSGGGNVRFLPERMYRQTLLPRNTLRL
ncbi:MAG: SNF2-related protein [Chloroflexaceae bacterium]